MKTFLSMFFALFAAVSFTAFAADSKFDKDDPASVREYAEKGDPEAQYYLGLNCEKENNMAEAAQWYAKAAEQDDLDAQFKLGVCYENGTGVPRDYREAVKWYRKAAEKGIVEAQLALGACYENGRGLPPNCKEAVNWYRKAADRKNPEAQYRLGSCFENRKEVRSEDKAAIWYRRAAENGHAGAQYKIAQFYETGKGVEKNMNEAISWYSKSAEQGNMDAMISLGRYYSTFDSKGNPLDMATAIRWYAKAAEQGFQDADLFDVIGSFYEDGKYVKQDLKKAFDWYRKAAELGSAHAQARLEQQRLDEEAAQKAREEAARKAREEEAAARKAREEESARRAREDAAWKAMEEAARKAREEAAQKAREEDAARKAREEAERDARYAKAAEKALAQLIGSMTVTMTGEKTTIAFPNRRNLEMIKVEAGTFETQTKGGPQKVTLTKDYFIGKTEVTQGQWKAVMGYNPSEFEGDDLPVMTISWNEAMSFCENLNSTGKAPKGWRFTLPTEMQWEYAACGGNKSKGYTYSGSNNIDDVGWYMNNSSKTQPVGKKRANELGLYDISGNVNEWCLDDWKENRDAPKAEFTRQNDRGGKRVIRGGCWNYADYDCQVKRRGDNAEFDYLPNNLGFRLALVPESY
ncbi:MAG: SEL1-like repeat protein [Lentisphaeria bacterium]|nr:SEL1-like repeat protein [Lentisphaeria bacterium]